MTNDKYILRYLPLFYKDLEEKIVYIAETLQNSKAAQELLDAVEKAILERATALIGQWMHIMTIAKNHSLD